MITLYICVYTFILQLLPKVHQRANPFFFKEGLQKHESTSNNGYSVHVMIKTVEKKKL